MHNPSRCSKCGSFECNPFKCRFCNCPSWWNCDARGCYEQAKARYADSMVARDMRRHYEGDPTQRRSGGTELTTSGQPLKLGR